MFPPVFDQAEASAPVVALLKTNDGPLRVYPFGEATQATPKPYAVWQIAYGSPDNLLACVPSMDTFGVQFDVYANTGKVARQVTEALVNAFEPFAYVVSWNGEFKDDPTDLYRVSFTAEWMTPR